MRRALRWARRTLAALLVLTLVAAGAGLGYRAWRQSRAERALAIGTAGGIDEASFVRINGVDQWIWIRGQSRSNPVLLVIHGGPGNATSILAESFLRFERDYTVVHWDQPGAGKTFAQAGARLDPSLSIDHVVQDGIAVAQFLRTRLAAERVVLLGWSWGSLIGIRMARERPDLFDAYVGTGQIVAMRRGEEVAYARVLAEAKRRGDTRAIAELRAIGPPPYASQRELGVQRSWASRFEGTGSLWLRLLAAVACAPRYSLVDGVDYGRGMLASMDLFLGPRMRGPLLEVDLTSEPSVFEVPVFVIDGADDSYTPAELARDYVASLKAPQKQFMAIDGAGHLALLTHGDAFLRILNERLRPILRAGG